MEIFYIYRKLLFYFILLPKTLMFSLSEYLSRRQPGDLGREGGERGERLSVLTLGRGSVHTNSGYQTVNGLY